MTTAAVRPHVAVTVTRHGSGVVELAVSSDGRPRPGWRFGPDEGELAVGAVDSFRRNGATIMEEEA